MVVNGSSYAALGWRPRGLTPACRNFPEIVETRGKNTAAKQTAELIAEPEPSSEPEPKGEPEPTSEPEPKSEPEPEPSSEPEPTTTLKPNFRQWKLRQKSVSSRAAKSSEAPKREDSIETSVSYRVSASRGKREAEEPKPEPEPQGETFVPYQICTYEHSNKKCT